MVNQFGFLRLTQLSKLFPKLYPKMIQEVLITLEFCIRVDPLLLKEEMLSLTEQYLVEECLYFPALVAAEAHEVFKQDQQCLHWAYWQLETDENHIIPLQKVLRMVDEGSHGFEPPPNGRVTEEVSGENEGCMVQIHKRCTVYIACC